MKSKTPTKKQAATGRGVKCSKCCIDMKQHATIDGTWDWQCSKCGLRHEGSGSDYRTEFSKNYKKKALST